MEETRLILHPGEAIRTPRILLLSWNEDHEAAHNRFRRLLLFKYVPQEEGKPVRLPLASQCFDRYSWTRPEWATEAGQIAAAKFAGGVGFDTHWLDAAWFVGGFSNGVGNWFTKPAEFPRGLGPVAEACHAMGMRFVVWFEPERVAAGSQIAREHPEFVFGGEKGASFGSTTLARGGGSRTSSPGASRSTGSTSTGTTSTSIPSDSGAGTIPPTGRA